MHYDDIPGGEKPFSNDMLNDPVKRGFYLGTIAHCMECHARTPDGTQDYVNWWGRGGFVFTAPWARRSRSNITSHPTTGHWRLDRRRDAGARSPKASAAMAARCSSRWQRQIYFAKMTDADIDAIIAWMRTIPPLE